MRGDRVGKWAQTVHKGIVAWFLRITLFYIYVFSYTFIKTHRTISEPEMILIVISRKDT